MVLLLFIVKLVNEELKLLHEPGAYIGVVVKLIDKKKVYVNVPSEGKFIVDIDKNIDIKDVVPTCRVALRYDNYVLYKVLPNKVCLYLLVSVFCYFIPSKYMYL